MRAFVLPTVLLALCLGACAYDNEEELFPDNGGCDTLNVSYSETVKPILDANCTVACHNDIALNGGITLEEHADVIVQVENGRLLGSIRHDPGFKRMPQGQPRLPDCTLDKIEAWVNAGYPDN